MIEPVIDVQHVYKSFSVPVKGQRGWNFALFSFGFACGLESRPDQVGRNGVQQLWSGRAQHADLPQIERAAG